MLPLASVDTTPELDRSKPVAPPIVAVPLTYRFVVVALVATTSVAVRLEIAAETVSIALVIMPVMVLAATEVGLLPEEALRNDVAFAFSVAAMRCAIDASSAARRAST